MKTSMPLFWLLLSLPGLVCAHDPGLSIAELHLGKHDMTTWHIYAQDALAPLLGDVSPPPWTRQNLPESALRELASRGIELQVGDRVQVPEDVVVRTTSDDGVTLLARFPYTADSPLRIDVPLLGQLAHGHRQLLTVRDQAGRILGRYTLKVGKSTLLLDNIAQ